jgi:hypothetical protein
MTFWTEVKVKPFQQFSPVRSGTSQLAHQPRRKRLVTSIALASLLTSSFLPLSGCKGQNFNIGPSGGEIAGVIIGAAVVVGGTTAILIHVNHSHHQVKGCVSSGPNGLEVRTEDNKTWLLTGNTPNVQVGDFIKFHGTKVKRPKQSPGSPTFEVEKISKDYGPCKVAPASKAALSEPDRIPKAE